MSDTEEPVRRSSKESSPEDVESAVTSAPGRWVVDNG